MPLASPVLAVTLIEALIAGGVRDVVLAPGSRSGPIALVLADAERRGLLRLHVRVDERSAAYLALGLSRISGAPTAVVTTSGTAAVNLHPAMVEAMHSGVPIIAVTADRPGAMRGSGANQTIHQPGLYGDDVFGVDLEGLEVTAVRQVVADALDRAVGPRPGPVHLNVPFSEPLIAAGAHAVSSPAVSAREPRACPTGEPLASLLPAGVNPARGILLVGDGAVSPLTRAAAERLAEQLGWPLVSEPSGNLTSAGLAHGPLVLGRAAERDLAPEVVVTVGRVGLHRAAAAVIRGARAHVAVDVPPFRGMVDPVRTAPVIVSAVPIAGDLVADPHWRQSWLDLDAIAARIVDDALTGEDLTGPGVARLVANHASRDDLLVIGASGAVRHVATYAGPLRAECIGNRGTSGIDGVMSTAWGAAIAHADRHPASATYALVGDLTAIYDRNGLLAPADEPRPPLTYVVIDNDGGGIFSTLEEGAPAFAADFERVYGTPHGADLGRLLTAPGIDVIEVATMSQLRAVLDESAPVGLVRVVVAKCQSRAAEAALVRSIREAVEVAVTR